MFKPEQKELDCVTTTNKFIFKSHKESFKDKTIKVSNINATEQKIVSSEPEETDIMFEIY